MARLQADPRDVNPTSVRLSPEARQLIKRIRVKLGLKQTAVIELAIRRLAEMEQIK